MICPNCFKEVSSYSCSYCGYTYDYSNRDMEVLEPGKLLSMRYVIGRCLGRGGFGITYLAYDTIEDELCALKEYFPGDISSREDDGYLKIDTYRTDLYNSGKKNFIEEAKILKKIRDCENIVKVKNFFAENNTAYLVMEYLDGMNVKRFLSTYYQNGKMSFNNAYIILCTVAKTLVNVHARGILHRDITPENIFITNDGSITLIDFGSSREFMRQNLDGMSVYIKPGYAPPEQYHYNGKQGPWSDIYSLAATFYYLISGVNIRPAKERMIEDNLLPLSQLNSDVSPHISNVISKSLCLDYSKRYQTVEDFIYDLEKPSKAADVKPCIKIILGPTGKKGIKKLIMMPNKYYSVGRREDKNILPIANDNVGRIAHCYIRYLNSEKCFEVIDNSSTGTYELSKSQLVQGKAYKYPSGTQLYLGDGYFSLIELALE